MKSDWYFLTSLLQFRDYLYFSGFILLKRSKILGVNSYRNFTLHFKTLNICIEKNLRTLECMSRSAKQLINIGLRDRDLNLTVYDKTAPSFVHRLRFSSSCVQNYFTTHTHRCHGVSKIFLLINIYKLPWINILNIV